MSYTPHLNYKHDFIAALKDYKINPEAERVLAATPMVLMIAATSSGRNTIIGKLMKTGHYHFIVSDTTRPKRVNKDVAEQDGVEYFFRTEEDILADIKAGRYVEAAIIHDQQVSGVSIREIERAHTEAKIAITDIEVQGAGNILRLKPDTKLIFVLPPSFEVWLQRLMKRSNFENIELYRRLNSAVQEYTAALNSKHCVFVINDDLDEAVKAVDDIARFGLHRQNSEQHARELAGELLEATREYMKEHLADALVVATTAH